MNLTKKRILCIIIALLIIIGICFFNYWKNRVTPYPEGTTGNTSCNLLNGGFFAESDETIYFANPNDQNTLYSMNNNLEHIKKVTNDNVSYLNASGKYIFYTRRNDKKEIDSDALLSLSSTGLFRINTNGLGTAKLYGEPTQVACLYGNHVFYQHFTASKGLQLYSCSIDGATDKMLLEEACSPNSIVDNTIYYLGNKKDHSIHTMNTDGSNKKVLYNGNFTSLSIQGDYLYILDMADNYSLKRIPLDGGEPEALVSERLATYNVSPHGDIIYCQIDNGENNGLYEYNIDSKQLTKITDGNFNFLHIVAGYLFYEDYDQSNVYALNLADNSQKKLELPKD